MGAVAPVPLPDSSAAGAGVPLSTPSLGANSAARLASEFYGFATSLITAALTARILGPSGKGFYSTLMLLSVLLVQLFNAGLGEAAIVLVGRGKATLDTATTATTSALLPLGVVGAVVFFLLGSVTMEVTTSDERNALVLASVLVLLNVASTTMVWYLVLLERILLVAAFTAISATVTVFSLSFMLTLTDLRVSGGVLASLLACSTTLAGVLLFLRRGDVHLRPVWNSQYLRSALRLCAALQVSNLLVQVAGRLDLIVLYRLTDSAAAGRYSIALTIGTLVTSIPTAIAFAAFPRLAQLEEAEARVLTAKTFRMGIAAAFAMALLFAVSVSTLIPAVFGRDYEGAVAPSMFLIAGAMFWSGQWVLCRAAAARGKPKALFASFTANFLTMLILDLALIPSMEEVGAGIATLVASVVGLVVACLLYPWHGERLGDFVPRAADVRESALLVRRVLSVVPGRQPR